MASVKIERFADLFAAAVAQGATSATIRCALTGRTVRRLQLDNDAVIVDACYGPDGVIRVALDEPVTYEPWMLDRGSLLFSCRELNLPRAKLATEFDVLCFEDGREFALLG